MATGTAPDVRVWRKRFVQFALLSYDDREQRRVLSARLETEFSSITTAQSKYRIYQAIEHSEQLLARVEGLRDDAIDMAGSIPAPRSEHVAERWEQIKEDTRECVLSIEHLERLYKPLAAKSSIFFAAVGERVGEAQSMLAEAYASCERARRSSKLRQLDEQRQNKIRREWDRTNRNLFRTTKNAWAQRQRPCPIPCVEARNLGHEWKLQGRLEGGGMGDISVMATDDGHGRISDRMVVKDTWMSERAWNNETRWFGEVSREACDRKVPVEFWAHHQATRGKHRNVLGLISMKPQIHEQERVYRLLLEYAGEGDLSDLILRHYFADQKIPEPFIIYVFKALVETCLILKNGSLDTSASPPADWQEIVHRDLKPENIFLGEPNARCFPNYPEPKLADFGLAMLTTPMDPSNPLLWAGPGTLGYFAPEQGHFADSKTKAAVDDFKILSPCNVWGIGAILKCLIENRVINKDEQPCYLPGGNFWYWIDDDRASSYDAEVRNLVQNCMAFDPSSRPTLEELKMWIDRRFAEQPWLNDASAGLQNESEHALLNPTQRYEVGMALKDLQPQANQHNSA